MIFIMKTMIIFFLSLLCISGIILPITIETDRLVLRVMTPDDAPALFEVGSDQRVVQLTGVIDFHETLSDTQAYIQRNITSYQQGNSIHWVIVYKPENRVVGLCGLYACSQKHHKAEIGYALAYDYWGRGIATEAARAVVAYGFTELGLNRIQATFDPRNDASGRVLEKLGFRYEGLLRDYYYFHNEFSDRVMLSILKCEIP